MKTASIYYSGDGTKRLLLTTDSPASHYGIPVLRLIGFGEEADYGPGERLPTGHKAADFVRACVIARVLPPGLEGGRLAPEREAVRKLAEKWLAQLGGR